MYGRTVEYPTNTQPQARPGCPVPAEESKASLLVLLLCPGTSLLSLSLNLGLWAAEAAMRLLH